jgi:hypothetical protein
MDGLTQTRVRVRSDMSSEGTRRGRWKRWVVAFTLGELIGFGGLPAAGGVLATWALASIEGPTKSLLLYVVAIVGGLGEGAILAAFQRPVLREQWPALDQTAWIRNTAVAAAVAWSLGMLAPTLDDLVGLEPAMQIAIWVPASVGILLSIGYAQARVLRAVTPRANGWIGANVLGWLLGLPWTFLAPAAMPDDAPPWVFVLAFVVAGVLMGATVGAVTGRWLVNHADETERLTGPEG